MVSVSELQGQVASRFERLNLPSWADPHPNMGSPGREEYSRVTDPERYRVVHARARAWAAVLVEVLGARAQTLEKRSPTKEGRSGAFDWGVRLTPGVPGGLPLLLLERDTPTDAGDATMAVLDIAVGDPSWPVSSVPNCGCDACDSGSGDLLDVIDSTIGQVVGGPFVVLQGKKWRAQWHPDGGNVQRQGRGPDFEEAMDMCRRIAEGSTVRLPRHTESLVGRSWLT